MLKAFTSTADEFSLSFPDNNQHNQASDTYLFYRKFSTAKQYD